MRNTGTNMVVLPPPKGGRGKAPPLLGREGGWGGKGGAYKVWGEELRVQKKDPEEKRGANLKQKQTVKELEKGFKLVLKRP